jgi:hypothetical protein
MNENGAIDISCGDRDWLRFEWKPCPLFIHPLE